MKNRNELAHVATLGCMRMPVQVVFCFLLQFLRRQPYRLRRQILPPATPTEVQEAPMAARIDNLWEVFQMPKHQPPGSADDDLPPFTPKVKKPTTHGRDGTGVQTHLGPKEKEGLDDLVEQSLMSQKDYLRCLIRYAIRQHLVLDGNSEAVAEPPKRKDRRER
jgi:hypothetical protein